MIRQLKVNQSSSICEIRDAAFIPAASGFVEIKTFYFVYNYTINVQVFSGKNRTYRFKSTDTSLNVLPFVLHFGPDLM